MSPNKPHFNKRYTKIAVQIIPVGNTSTLFFFEYTTEAIVKAPATNSKTISRVSYSAYCEKRKSKIWLIVTSV